MARKTKRSQMQATSVLLGLTVIVLEILVVAQLRHRAFHMAFIAEAWALGFLAILLAWTWPTKCRVIGVSTKRACPNEAFGFLFGCRKAPHFWDKFLARIRLGDREIVKPTERRPRAQPTTRYASLPLPSDSVPQHVRVTIEEGFRDKCGWWISVGAAVATVIQTIVVFTGR